jgi:hypothetical protein
MSEIIATSDFMLRAVLQKHHAQAKSTVPCGGGPVLASASARSMRSTTASYFDRRGPLCRGMKSAVIFALVAASLEQ